MPFTSILYLAAIFVAVFGCSLLLTRAVMSNKSERRMQSLADDQPPGEGAASTQWLARIAQASGTLARLSVPDEGSQTSSLRARFMQAGLRGSHVPTIYFAAKTVLAAALPALLWLASAGVGIKWQTNTLLMCLLLAAAAGFYLPNGVIAVMIRRRQREIFENFPDALDLMTVCIEAGFSTVAAIGRVATEMAVTSQVVSDELHLVTLELRAGNSKEQALRNLVMRTGVDDVDMLVTMLIQAEQFGTSIADSLRVHSEHLRVKRRQLAEECAAKVALKLLMPLIFCIFPALILIMLGPSFIQISRVLLPSLAGQ